MKHYICTGGCEAVSSKPGICEAEDCVKNGEPFEECDCADGLHGGAFAETADEGETEEE